MTTITTDDIKDALSGWKAFEYLLNKDREAAREELETCPIEKIEEVRGRLEQIKICKGYRHKLANTLNKKDKSEE